MQSLKRILTFILLLFVAWGGIASGAPKDDIRDCVHSVIGGGTSLKSLLNRALQSAITANGSNQVILRVPPGKHRVVADLSIPANVSLKVERGAVLSVAPGATLTINGGLDAGFYQIFSQSGSGKVVFGPGAVKEVYPQWWGAVADGTTDNTAAIQACLTSACSVPRGVVSGGAVVKFPAGTYKFNTLGSVSDTYFQGVVGISSAGRVYKIRLQGVGNPVFTCSATFKNVGTEIGFAFVMFQGNVELEVDGITFERPSAMIDKKSVGIVLTPGGSPTVYPASPKITNCTFRNVSNGIYSSGSPGLVAQNNRFYATAGYGSFYNGPITWPCVGILGGDSAWNRDWLVTGNEFDGCTSGTIGAGGAFACSQDGLVLTYGPGNTITNNRIRHHGVEGIFIYNQVTSPVSTMNHIITGNVIDSTLATGQTDFITNWGIRCDQGNAVISGNTIVNAADAIVTYRNDSGSPWPYDVEISDNIIQMRFFSGIGLIYGILGRGIGLKIHDNIITWPDAVAGYSTSDGVCGIYAGCNLTKSAIYRNKIVIRTPDAGAGIVGILISADGSSDILFRDNETEGCNMAFSFNQPYLTGGPWTIEHHHSTSDTIFMGNIQYLSSYPGKLLIIN